MGADVSAEKKCKSSIPYVLAVLAVAGCIITFLMWRMSQMSAALAASSAMIQSLTQELDAIKNPKELAVNGQAFIVTQGGQNIKLGLISIGVLALSDVEQHLAKQSAIAAAKKGALQPKLAAAKRDYEAADKATVPGSRNFMRALAARSTAYRALSPLSRSYDYFDSGEFYFDGLPPALKVVKSDSDGIFSVTVPTDGNYVIAAQGSRHVGDDVEKYYWLIDLSAVDLSEGKLFLSNDNLTSSESIASLIQTN